MRQYIQLLSHILDNGSVRSDRTGTGTKSVFGHMYRHSLSDGFPLLTTKKIHLKSVLLELLWFIRGETNVRYLRENGVSIWDEWATESGELGPVYGNQWRRWPALDIVRCGELDKAEFLWSHGYEQLGTVSTHDGRGTLFGKEIDQISELVDGIRNRPFSRRHIINAWNVAFLPDEDMLPCENAAAGRMALPPCHVMYQFHVSNDGKLDCMLTQRSADAFLGLPFNLASVSLLTHMLAQQCDLTPGTVVHSIGDMHLYSNHLEQAKLQISREPRPLPQLVIKRKPDTILDYSPDDFEIVGYDPHPHIRAEISK